MTKIKFVILLFLVVFIFGCDQNKEPEQPENPALSIFKEFESSQNVKMEVKLNIDE